MSQGSRSTRIRKSRKPKRLSLVQVLFRLIVLLGIIGLVGFAGLLLWQNLTRQGTATEIAFDLNTNPALSPVEAAGLEMYIRLNQDTLNTPAGSDDSEVIFEINPGENAGLIAENLLSAGLIADTTLFRRYLRYYGLDRQMEAGTYRLKATMTIPQIAVTLTDATLPEIEIRITEGWRREQIADWIDEQPDIPFNGSELLAASGSGAAVPPVSIAGEIPPDGTLEGFLFPDTYRVAIDASAEDFVAKMLENLDKQFTPEMRTDANARGLTVYQVLTLASIVEREAAVAEERPTIASVYLNRLAVDMKLQADPTVQYAMGFQADSGEWWNLGLTQEDYVTVDSAYNTYVYPGLPPGPIANPGLDSIRAVIYPAETVYLFFRAACDDSGRHLFATTFEEHVANACP